jgi:hypothetical protein
VNRRDVLKGLGALLSLPAVKFGKAAPAEEPPAPGPDFDLDVGWPGSVMQVYDSDQWGIPHVDAPPVGTLLFEAELDFSRPVEAPALATGTVDYARIVTRDGDTVCQFEGEEVAQYRSINCGDVFEAPSLEWISGNVRMPECEL